MSQILMNRRVAIAGLCVPWMAQIAWADSAEVGIVLLHGKQSSPSRMSGLADDLRAEGFLVSTPAMPWSQTRELDVPYPQALNEIEAAATELIRQGAKRIVVGGHSLGANAAIAYAASGRSVAAIFAIGPGHIPERGGFRKLVTSGVEQARDMIAKGAGDEKASFPDINQGRTREIRTTANAYLSYFDPDGIAAMPRSAAAIPKPLPIFMAVGDSDPITGYARTAIYDAAPPHEKSVYIDGPGDHFSTIRIVTPKLVAWLKSVMA